MNRIETARAAEITALQNSVQRHDAAQAENTPQNMRIEEPQYTDRPKSGFSKVGHEKTEQVNRKQQLSAEELQEQVAEANRVLEENANKQLSFFIDAESGKQGVRVINAETKEVIKQIPPEQTLNLAARIKDQIGALLDEKM